ncbi:MAG: hypothetical protein IIX45_04860 [Lachnospiraceae bacterium]|nr:hypothetical protein [Lachnospiraceae bacterium]
MKKPKRLRKTYLLLSILLIFIVGIQVNAAKALNTAFATSAKSVLVDRATISYTAVLPELPASDDGILYLYEMQPYEYAVALTATPVASAPASLTPVFSVPFTESRLYTKLGLAVKSAGQNVLIANPQYIINPELLATHTRARQVRPLKSEQGKDFCNLYMSENLPGVLAGRYTTAQIMNNGTNQTITNPYSRKGIIGADTHPVQPRHYMLNASEPAAITAIARDLSNCAANSTIENFILGNEVNVRTWNYMMWTDWDSYIREYAQVFRVAYNAIKSQNANARVFICIDQNWDRNRAPGNKEYYEYIDGKDFIAKFNALIASEGNIDWNVAQHPYPVPLTYSKFWDMSGCKDGAYMAAQVNSGKMMTFQNLSLLSTYLMSPELLSPNGTPRRIILSEIGLTNAQGVDVQAAALYASYVAAKSNPLVDEIIYLLAYSEPMVDTRLSGQAQQVYNSLGTASEATYDAWAKAVIGISDWSQVIR